MRRGAFPAPTCHPHRLRSGLEDQRLGRHRPTGAGLARGEYTVKVNSVFTPRVASPRRHPRAQGLAAVTYSLPRRSETVAALTYLPAGSGGSGAAVTYASERRREAGAARRDDMTYVRPGGGDCGPSCCGARWPGWQRPPLAGPPRTVSGGPSQRDGVLGARRPQEDPGPCVTV